MQTESDIRRAEERIRREREASGVQDGSLDRERGPLFIDVGINHEFTGWNKILERALDEVGKPLGLPPEMVRPVYRWKTAKDDRARRCALARLCDTADCDHEPLPGRRLCGRHVIPRCGNRVCAAGDHQRQGVLTDNGMEDVFLVKWDTGRFSATARSLIEVLP